MGLLIGIISSFLGSLGGSFWKKAVVESKMSDSLFSFFSYILGSIMAFIIFLFYGFNFEIFKYKGLLIFIIILMIVGLINELLRLYIYKIEKLSTLLPYASLDKVFVVILGFFIFSGTSQQGSITTLIVTFVTIGVIFFFSTDLGKISFPKTIVLFFISKLISAGIILGVGYLLLTIKSTDFVIIESFLMLVFFGFFILIKRESFKDVFRQSKIFYTNRIQAKVVGWTGYMLGLYIIESAGVIVATLLGFFTIVFSVVTMRLILDDVPSKKQVILSFFVILMIGIGYYFK